MSAEPRFQLDDDVETEDGTERGTVLGVFRSETTGLIQYVIEDALGRRTKVNDIDVHAAVPLTLVTYALPATLILHVSPTLGVVQLDVQPSLNGASVNEFGPDHPTKSERVATEPHVTAGSVWPVLEHLDPDGPIRWEA